MIGPPVLLLLPIEQVSRLLCIREKVQPPFFGLLDLLLVAMKRELSPQARRLSTQVFAVFQ